jgi:hypothetical protein
MTSLDTNIQVGEAAGVNDVTSSDAKWLVRGYMVRLIWMLNVLSGGALRDQSDYKETSRECLT